MQNNKTLSKQVIDYLSLIDEEFSVENSKIKIPCYCPKKHVKDIGSDPYYNALLALRHAIKYSIDWFFCIKKKAMNVDLFMITPSVSSPVGSGSDSAPVPLKFGINNAYLSDSAQFGFEPILMNSDKILYCYMPSLRNEDPDFRHLNQFFHCEAELRGNLEDIEILVEEFVTLLVTTIEKLPNLVRVLSRRHNETKQVIGEILKTDHFEKVSFNNACDLLNNRFIFIERYNNGRDITSKGEIQLSKVLKTRIPFWLEKYDRDRAPFYHKPDTDSEKVLNADLIFPPISKGAFGGEIVGCGQRQDDVAEIKESIKRQDVDQKPYNWYIDLRKDERYCTTAGFGMGIERFIAWVLGFDNIRDVILYPRLKNKKTLP